MEFIRLQVRSIRFVRGLIHQDGPCPCGELDTAILNNPDPRVLEWWSLSPLVMTREPEKRSIEASRG
jgi:hypothetical protein